MEFVLNGMKREFEGDPKLNLLKYLRNIEGIITPKDGCSGQKVCGACTVQVGDRAVLACATPMSKVEGKEIVTTDGMGQKIQDAFAKAFVEKGGIQCGFCIPGIVMEAKVLLEKNPNPTRDEIVKCLNRHLCRCTGYQKIIESIMYAAEIIQGQESLVNENLGPVGTRLGKYQAAETVLGNRPFVCDLKEKNMHFAALKLSDHPRAKVLRVNTASADALDGVLKVLTAKDIPGERITGLIVQDWPVMVAEGETTRYVGDVLACVVATSEEIAREAVSLLEIEYEVLKPITDPEMALDKKASKIHESGNALSVTEIKRGDIEKAFAESEHIVEGEYYSQRIEHAFLETECCLAKPWGKNGKKGVQVFSQGQGAYEDRRHLAKILGLKNELVNVIQVQNGGGFGGKEDLSVQGQAAVAAYLLDVPVRLFLTREESLLMHPKRHPMNMKYKLACDKAGLITALQADILGDTGAYASVGMKVLERAAGHATGAYHVPVVDLKAIAAYTNNVPCGAMRGFGVNQTAFAMEGCIDELCKKAGFDRWQFRYDNALKEGSMVATGQVLEAAVGVRKTLEAVREDFQNSKFAGIACGIKNCGVGNGMPDTSQAKVVVESADQVIIYHGWTEMGQGVHTMAQQTVCEQTGISPSVIEVRVDTDSETVCGMTTSSRGTSLVGHSLMDACKKLKEDLQSHSLADLAGREYKGEWICDWTTKPGKEKPGQNPVTHYSYSYATQVCCLDSDGKVEKVIAAHDAGRIMNPTLFEGQIEGAVHMGLGYALTEDFPMKDGYPESTKLHDCQIVRAKDMPEVEVRGLEVKDPHGPFGAKGVGEIGIVPTAAAVANAFCEFDGQRRYRLPMKRR